MKHNKAIMHISTADLFSIIDILKKYITSNFGSEILIDEEDFYWTLLPDGIYDSYNEPSNELGLGQLSDDWEQLLRLKNKQAYPISYDLIKLASILNVVYKKSIDKKLIKKNDVIMYISTSDLFHIIDILKEHIVSNFGSEILMDKEECYWTLLTDDIYDPYNEPSHALGLRQSSDDWEQLLRLKNKQRYPISYDIVRLVSILNVVYKKSIGKW